MFSSFFDHLAYFCHVLLNKTGTCLFQHLVNYQFKIIFFSLQLNRLYEFLSHFFNVSCVILGFECLVSPCGQGKAFQLDRLDCHVHELMNLRIYTCYQSLLLQMLGDFLQSSYENSCRVWNNCVDAHFNTSVISWNIIQGFLEVKHLSIRRKYIYAVNIKRV